MTYNNFAELAAARTLNADYEILMSYLDPRYAFFGIHAGSIERATDEAVRALGGEGEDGPNYSTYRFRGIMQSGNSALHIASTQFDEPNCERLLKQVSTVISIHGMTASTPLILVGGRDVFLRDRIITKLTEAQFAAAVPTGGDLDGVDPDNVCNRGTSGMGVQVEIGNLYRESEDWFDVNTPSGRWDSRNAGFYRCVRAIRSAVDLTDYRAE